MIRARFSPKAERDLDGIFNHIAADNPDAAARLPALISVAAALL